MPLTTDYSVRILIVIGKTWLSSQRHSYHYHVLLFVAQDATDIYNQLRSIASQSVYPQLRAMGLGGLGSVTGLAHLNRAIMEVRGERKRPEERNSDIRSNYILKQIGHQPKLV